MVKRVTKVVCVTAVMNVDGKEFMARRTPRIRNNQKFMAPYGKESEPTGFLQCGYKVDPFFAQSAGTQSYQGSLDRFFGTKYTTDTERRMMEEQLRNVLPALETTVSEKPWGKKTLCQAMDILRFENVPAFLAFVRMVTKLPDEDLERKKGLANCSLSELIVAVKKMDNGNALDYDQINKDFDKMWRMIEGAKARKKNTWGTQTLGDFRRMLVSVDNTSKSLHRDPEYFWVQNFCDKNMSCDAETRLNDLTPGVVTSLGDLTSFQLDRLYQEFRTLLNDAYANQTKWGAMIFGELRDFLTEDGNKERYPLLNSEQWSDVDSKTRVKDIRTDWTPVQKIELNKLYQELQEQGTESGKQDVDFQLKQLKNCTSTQERKNIYRKLLLQYHPDKVHTDVQKDKDIATAVFQYLNTECEKLV